MLVAVDLHRHSEWWTFTGSAALGVWLSGLPWLENGGMCVLHTGSEDFSEALIAPLGEVVCGLNQEARPIRICHVVCGGKAGAPLPGMLKSIGADPSLGRFEANRAFARAVGNGALVYICDVRGETSPTWWDEIADILESCSKGAISAPFSVIILDPHGSVANEPQFDFSVGSPTGSLLLDGAVNEDRLWHAYVHQRLGWEIAGRFGLARQLDRCVADLSKGDDETLESHLDDFSSDCFESHPGTASLRDFLIGRRDSERRRSPELERLAEELLSMGLLWLPPRSPTPRVAPWVSRALMRRGEGGDDLSMLRFNLVCAPLANEVFYACSLAESKLRSKLDTRRFSKPPSQETVENFERFRDGFSNVIIYPGAHPSPPTTPADIWMFASLGELLNAAPRGVVADMYWELLRLRNAVAHGHFVGWEHIKRAIDFNRQLY